MLMALLPLAGWADTSEVTIQCANIEFTYGDTNIPANGSVATAAMIGVVSNPSSKTKAEIAAALTFERIGDTSTDAKAEGYSYRLVKKTGYTGDIDVTITGGNGTLYILPKAITITADDKSKDFGAANPTFTASISPDLVSGETLSYTVTRTSTNENAGEYTGDLVVNLTEDAVSANYTITTVAGKFTINKLVADDTKAIAELTDAEEEFVYNYSAHVPALTVSYDGETLTTESGAITIAYTNNINAGQATATVNFKNYKTSGGSDYTKTVNFTIQKKSLGTDGVAAEGIRTQLASSAPAWTYNGTTKNYGTGVTKVYYRVDGTDHALTKTTDWTRTSAGDFINATEGVDEDNKPYYLFTGAGNNFEGTVKLYVTINKADLTVTAEDKTKTFGAADPEFTVTYGTFQNSETNAVLEGELAFTRDEGENPGTYAITPSGLTAKNYNIEFVPGTLTIGAANIVITAEAKTKVYGEEDPELTYTVSPANLASKLSNIVITRANAGTDEGVQTYTGAITVTADAVAGYDVVTNAANFTITKATLTVKAANQTIAQGTVPDTTIDEGDELYTVSGFKNGDTDAILDGKNPTLSTTLTTSSPVGETTDGVTVAKGDLPDLTNYDYSFVAGKVIIVGDNGTITLVRNEELADNLQAFDGKTGITVKFDDFELKKEKWYTMVLPFATSVQELSTKLGYAIVDTLNEANNTKNIQFRLHMQDLPANKPFIVKVYKDVNLNTVSFTGKTIAYAEDLTADDVCAKDQFGNKYIGTYAGKTGFAANEWRMTTDATTEDGKYKYDAWYYGGEGSETKTIAPLAAYVLSVNDGGDATFNAPVFSVEDIENGATVIKQLNAETMQAVTVDGWYTLNGVKLQGAPAQKGIYINNGKKVVIK